MRKISIIILLLCAMVSVASAQQITRNYHDRSLSDVLIDLDKASSRYKISFIYNELEDFTITQNVKTNSVPDAIRKVISYYPIKMTVGDSLITVECTRKSDHKLIGRLMDNHNQSVEFANIQLLNPQDSSFICGGVSNANGDFVIPCQQRQAIMKISYVGYKTICRFVSIARIGTVRMQAEAYHLKKVVVKGSLRTDHGDHATYTFNDEQVKNSRHSQDLLSTLPGLYTDPTTGTIKSMENKNIKILINNVPMTSDNDLRSIAAGKIKKVEYYDVPPMKYRGADIVMNVITKPMDTGYAVGYDVTSALTTGFVNGNAYYKYNKGYSQFSIDYSINMRNYRKWEGEDHYSFTLENQLADYLYQNHYHFGYTDNFINLKYAYSKPDDITFQITASPNFSHRFIRGTSDITAQNNPEWEDGNGWENRHTNTFGPSIDLYLSKPFAHGHQIDVDVLGTYYHNNQQILNQQWTTNEHRSLIDDNMRSKNDAYSLITEIDYSKEWEKSELDVGWYNWAKWSDYTIRNVVSSYEPVKSSSSINIQNVFAEFQGTLGKLVYRLGVSGTVRYQKAGDIRETRTYIRPKYSLSYPLKHGTIQLVSTDGINYPPISSLSENTTILIPGIVQQGNPNLKANTETGGILRFSHNVPWLYMQLALFGVYTDSPMNAYYQWKTIDGKQCIVKRYENANYMWWYGTQYAFVIKPFKSELLSVGLYGGAYRYATSSHIIGRHTYWSIPFTYQIRFHKGNFGMEYMGNINSKEINGTSLSWAEPMSTFSSYYQLGKWRFTLQCLWAFADAKYRNETLKNPVLTNQEQHVIKDNSHMFTIGVSWNFFSGKKKNVAKYISNSDADSGAFR